MKTLEAPGLDVIESEEQCILILYLLCSSVYIMTATHE